jgi:hypothetical protein
MFNLCIFLVKLETTNRKIFSQIGGYYYWNHPPPQPVYQSQQLRLIIITGSGMAGQDRFGNVVVLFPG